MKLVILRLNGLKHGWVLPTPKIQTVLRLRRVVAAKLPVLPKKTKVSETETFVNPGLAATLLDIPCYF